MTETGALDFSKPYYVEVYLPDGVSSERFASFQTFKGGVHWLATQLRQNRTLKPRMYVPGDVRVSNEQEQLLSEHFDICAEPRQA